MTITAHAVDTSTNSGDDSQGVTVDNAPPDTIIDSGPTGTVATSSASFSFHASQTGSTFACRLDGGSFATCSSPATYTNLANGPHTFEVRATDPAGNTDGSPASRGWTVNVSSSSVFGDGFESGDFSAAGWTVVQGGDGSATVQSATVKSGTFAARLSETANTGSVAYVRKNLGLSYDDLSVAADMQVQQEGASGGNVPFFRLYDVNGTRLSERLSPERDQRADLGHGWHQPVPGQRAPGAQRLGSPEGPRRHRRNRHQHGRAVAGGDQGPDGDERQPGLVRRADVPDRQRHVEADLHPGRGRRHGDPGTVTGRRRAASRRRWRDED